ncbi:MAG: hypothetical protein NPINA01_22060 [Nitrospinaceae bacterium]|nr:MAG: hypothetical protein NPINA01_22060 [Nitrospinaceae bacterium]
MYQKPALKFSFSGGATQITCLALLILFLTSCGESFRFEDFTFLGSEGKTEEAFYQDSKTCDAEKKKHSNKIQGREFGFKGQDVGYLGCMKLRGWEKKEPGLY